jgi:hypothetical protein
MLANGKWQIGFNSAFKGLTTKIFGEKLKPRLETAFSEIRRYLAILTQ